MYHTSYELVTFRLKKRGTKSRLDRTHARQYPMVLINSWVPLVYISAGVPNTRIPLTKETKIDTVTGTVLSCQSIKQ